MGKIFSHTDGDGDAIDVFSDERSPLCIEVKPVDEQSYIGYLDREAVKRLWLALGEWLHPDAGAAPLPYTNQSLIEQMIQRAVAAQVSAVLPLHLAPVRSTALNVAEARCDGTACCTPHPMDPEPSSGGESPYFANFPMADPEPHDVGHVDEPACARTSCTHPRSDHGRGISTACDCGDCFEYTTVASQAVTYFTPIHMTTEEDCKADNCIAARHLASKCHPTEDEWAQAPGRRVGNDGVALPYCKESSGGCGHSWGQHTGGECKARDFDLSNRAHNPCGCTARPQAAAVHSEYDREGEPVKAKCTCHKHPHKGWGETRECVQSGCFCRSSTR